MNVFDRRARSRSSTGTNAGPSRRRAARPSPALRVHSRGDHGDRAAASATPAACSGTARPGMCAG